MVQFTVKKKVLELFFLKDAMENTCKSLKAKGLPGIQTQILQN